VVFPANQLPVALLLVAIAVVLVVVAVVLVVAVWLVVVALVLQVAVVVALAVAEVRYVSTVLHTPCCFLLGLLGYMPATILQRYNLCALRQGLTLPVRHKLLRVHSRFLVVCHQLPR